MNLKLSTMLHSYVLLAIFMCYWWTGVVNGLNNITEMSDEMAEKSCPRSLREFKASATRLNCGRDENGRSQYVCVPKKDISTLVEFCYTKTVGLYEKDHCLVMVGNGFLDQTDCHGFRGGCPEEHFRTPDLYKFPACHEINPQNRCFLADPACPNTTQWTTTNEETDSFNLKIEMSTPVIQYTENSTHKVSNAWIYGVVASSVLLILILILSVIACIYLHGRKGYRIRKKKDEEEGHTLIQDNSTSNEEKLSQNIEHLLYRVVGDYSVWKTEISDQFYKLSDDEKCVLVCFLCAESGSPDFYDPYWLYILNLVRKKAYNNEKCDVTNEKAQHTLDKLKSSEFLEVDQKGVSITEDAADETMYLYISRSVTHSDFNLYFPSFLTTKRYLRSHRYIRKSDEKCVISTYSAVIDCLLIQRLQMDILNHVTMEDKHIFNKIVQLLNVPRYILKEEKNNREEFIDNLKHWGELVLSRRKLQDGIQHVKWHAEYWRPDTIRSCIGCHPHLDIYIIHNKAYRKPSRYHKYPGETRSLLYGLLFVNEYTVNINSSSFQTILKSIRERYFPELVSCNDADVENSKDDFAEKPDKSLTFKSDDIRHEVMYAFVTECLLEDSDLEFFLTTAASHVISEYCRSWGYEKKDRERCLFVPDRPKKILDLFIDKMQLSIITHCTVSDDKFQDSISKRLKVPREILAWDQEARVRYVEYAKRGTHTVHHSRGMIVGCAGAGKTTLLKRLLRCSEEDIQNVTSTEGLEVYEEIFQICDETKSLKVRQREDRHNHTQPPIKTVSFFDFGGQCAYYACHQIYLTRRAFYVVVVDASKNLDDRVDEKVCHQDGSVFSEWTYADYIVFWIKSIHAYYSSSLEQEQQTNVIIVATHWEDENRKYQDEEEFIKSLLRAMPHNSRLSQYISKKNCFFIKFPITPLKDLENIIVDIASPTNWEEKIPTEWAHFEIKINQRKAVMKVLNESDIELKMYDNEKNTVLDNNQEQNEKKDMLRYYHDAGKVLYFNEKGVDNSVISDVQWFIDAFKNIITDKLHRTGIPVSREDWEEYYDTGNLPTRLLIEIWKNKDADLQKQLELSKIKDFTDDISDNLQSSKESEVYFTFRQPFRGQAKQHRKTSPYLLENRETILNFMQTLGLVATGGEYHYVPCMNRRDFDGEIRQMILDSKSKSSILFLMFQFLPYFFFFRLIVACMNIPGWKVLKSRNTSCLYRNAALFSFDDHYIVIAVTDASIQLQIFQPVSGRSLEVETTHRIQHSVEDLLRKISTTFHRRTEFVRGFTCKNENEQRIPVDIGRCFIPEYEIVKGDREICPLHQVVDLHFIDTNQLLKYWDIQT